MSSPRPSGQRPMDLGTIQYLQEKKMQGKKEPLLWGEGFFYLFGSNPWILYLFGFRSFLLGRSFKLGCSFRRLN